MLAKYGDAHKIFAGLPSNATAADFLSKLRECEEQGLIGDDEFHNGLQMVEHFLWTGNVEHE